MIKFDWDERKNTSNVKKHKVDFEEAQTAFHDPNARVISDPDHSEFDEERFILLGYSSKLRMLVVCHCYREGDEIIRIISARRATKHEQKQYKGFQL